MFGSDEAQGFRNRWVGGSPAGYLLYMDQDVYNI